MERDRLVLALDRLLGTEEVEDCSLNGLQVEGPEEIELIAFAVDASLATMEEAVDLEPVPHCIGETGQLDAVRAHDANAAKLQSLREIEDRAAFHQSGEGALGGERGYVRRQRGCDPGG